MISNVAQIEIIFTKLIQRTPMSNFNRIPNYQMKYQFSWSVTPNVKTSKIRSKMKRSISEALDLEVSGKKSKIDLAVNSLKNIRKILECPVCLTTPSNPGRTHFCSNYHVICNSCFMKVEKCPTCRCDKFIVQNTFLQNILSVLPKICPYSEEGCNQEFEPEDETELEKHVENCDNRRIDCLHSYCASRVSYSVAKFAAIFCTQRFFFDILRQIVVLIALRRVK